jgi:queuine tRNA-ribosyltransferase
MFGFKIDTADGSARAGVVTTPHGEFRTPAFMPVGTAGALKGLPYHWAEETGAEIVLANAYHLWLRPGPEVIRSLGGLHKFTGWRGPMLTDSGGFQAFSLDAAAEIDEGGITFRDDISGARRRLDPKTTVELEEAFGADIIMPLDDCPPHPSTRDRVAAAVVRTTRWAGECRRLQTRKDQALFGIVQGGVYADLREQSAAEITALDLPGYAVGGVSVGEGPELLREAAAAAVKFLPADRPRYLMGVGTPVDLLDAVAMGYDMFDCVLPTRWARHTWAATSGGMLKMRNAAHAADGRPLDAECGCAVCGRYSRALIRHLYLAGEMAAPILVAFHNLSYYAGLMLRAREAVADGRYEDFRRKTAARFAGPTADEDRSFDLTTDH